MRPLLRGLTGAWWAVFACDVNALDLEEDRRTDVQVTVERTSGRYGEPDRTDITNVPFVIRHRAGRWTGEMQAPLLVVSSFETVLPGIGSVNPQPRRQRVTERGLGDVWLKLSYELHEYTSASTGVDLTLKVKTATGDVNRGLGTGATDVALQFELLQNVAQTTAFGHAGYRRTGDPSGFKPYRDPWYGEIGAFTPMLERCQVGAFYDYRQPLTRLGPLREVTVYGACTSGPSRWQLHATGGFADASADVGIGLTYRYRF